MAFGTGSASAEGLSAWFHLTSESSPEVLQRGGSGQELAVSAVNVGDAISAGSPVRLVDVLPAGLRAVSVAGNSTYNGSISRGPVGCVLESAREVQCSLAKGTQPWETGSVPPFGHIEAIIGVAVEPGAVSGEVNRVSVSGGGAPPAGVAVPFVVGKAGEATPFGIERYELSPEEVGGSVDTQAGSHPFQLTTTLNLNEASEQEPAALAKDLTFKLPAGLIGDPTAFPHCTLVQFTTIVEGANECPAASVLGVAVVSYQEAGASRLNTSANPIFNLEPSPGEAARFGFEPASIPAFLSASVRTGEDYGVTVRSSNIAQTIGFVATTATFWGVPGDPRHDDARNYGCLGETDSAEKHAPCTRLEESTPPPFLSLPTSCSGKPLESSVLGDSWAQPSVEVAPLPDPSVAMASMDGCGLLPFGSQIKASADVETASSPSGLNVDVHVPEEEALNPIGLAPADVRNITVTLPEGVVVNPSSADGLQACSLEQIGFKGVNPETGVDEFTPGEASCPNASKIANVKITTPILPNPLKGFAYLAAPQNFAGPLENPFGSLTAMYIVARDPVSGVLVKLPGKVSLNESTGQLTATIENSPQAPFEDAELEFFGGDRAPLATPPHCGTYETTASFEPWSNTEAHHEALPASSRFNITSGPKTLSEPAGSPCPGTALPFAPSLASETTDINAGSFTPLSTTLSREDGQQNIQSVALHYPTGVSGILAGVTLCGEAQANAGTCPAASEIGETIVSVGLGGDPFTVTGGKVYITGPYQGAPFGLSIVNPAKAGPFVLQEGRPVVVRARIEVNPTTAALTITTDTTGAHAIPRIIEGIPLQIKHVNVTVTRPGFTLNPTNCNPMVITGAISSAEGASSPVQVPFQVTNCATLKFEPKFTATTSGNTSKAYGASLTFKVTRATGPGSGQANFAKVKVDLPKQLPSRLTTLQKACTAAQFNANPAGCPAASIVGHVRVQTPVLPVPLEGPAYFVSHGGEAFPSLIFVLQGDNVTLDVISTTFISKAGITSGTLNNVPDAPFTTFELTLPEGKYSALAANANLCKNKNKLTAPTAFTAQNGLTIHQNTKITVTGCKKPKKPTKKHKKAKKGAKKKH